MQLTTALRRLARNDARLISRDTFLTTMLVYMVFISASLRLALPALSDHLAATADLPFSLVDLYPMMVAYVAIFLGAALSGIVFAFILLDERDNDTLKALLVTQLPLRHYLTYRVGIPTLIGFVMVFVCVLILNLVVPPLPELLLISAVGALFAPVCALLFASVAENRVQGLAMGKFVGLVGFLIILAWFVPEPWQLLFGLLPPFWVAKAMWLALEANPYWPLALAVGVVTHAALIVWFARRFTRVAYE